MKNSKTHWEPVVSSCKTQHKLDTSTLALMWLTWTSHHSLTWMYWTTIPLWKEPFIINWYIEDKSHTFWKSTVCKNGFSHSIAAHLHSFTLLFNQKIRSKRSSGELQRLYRQLLHSYPTNLFNLVRRKNPTQAHPETPKILHDISLYCDPCQSITSSPLSFRVSFSSDSARFNKRIYMDVFHIKI